MPPKGFKHSAATIEKLSALNSAQQSEAVGLYRGGLSAYEVARRLGVKCGSVYYCLEKNNVPVRKGGFRKGAVPWNAGLKHDEETRAHMNLSGLSLGRAWNKGKVGVYSPEHIKRLKVAHTGKNGVQASNWKGGVSRAYKTGFYSAEYKAWRKKVFERDGYACQKCGIKTGKGQAVYLTAHHIKSFAKYPDLRFVVANGLTLCELCHCEEDKYRARFMKKETRLV